jgi:TRAP-type C4-dicarboxylate transport system permease small subunit
MLVKKAFAQINIGQKYKLGGNPITSVFSSLGEFVSHLLNPIYVIAGVIMMFLLIFGGISVIIGAGKQDSGQMEKGQKAITAAVVGFIIIVGSFFIIQLIEVITGVQILRSGL